jgi:hypothetical protein
MMVADVHSWSAPISRRQAFQTTAATAIVVSSSSLVGNQPALAVPDEETPRATSRLGGQLEAFQDGPRSIRMMVPSGWNKFEGEVGAYDIKWYVKEILSFAVALVQVV